MKSLSTRMNESFDKPEPIVGESASETSKNSVTKLLIKYGNSPKDVEKMVELHFDDAYKMFTSNTKIAEYIRSVY